MAKQPSVLGGEFIHKPSAQFKRLSFPGHRKGAADLVHRHAGENSASATTRSCLRQCQSEKGMEVDEERWATAGNRELSRSRDVGVRSGGGDGTDTRPFPWSFNNTLTERKKRKETGRRVLRKSVRMEEREKGCLGDQKLSTNRGLWVSRPLCGFDLSLFLPHETTFPVYRSLSRW